MRQVECVKSGYTPRPMAITTLAAMITLATLTLNSSPVLAQTAPPKATPTGADPQTLNYRLQPRQIARNTWVVEGAVEDFSRGNGCNIINTAFIVAPEGVLVVNTGPSRLYGEQQRQAIARITQQPVTRVLNLNLHPDYFFGNQAYAGVPVQALAGSIRGMQAEGKAYEDNLFRLCGDWMKGTEATAANTPATPGLLNWGTHRLELLRLNGHTSDDLVLIDHSTGVVFAGGLVFKDRVPTTPHADLAAWQRSLLVLRQRVADPAITVVPSHGPVHVGTSGIEQTADWLQWLDQTLRDSAQRGLDLGEVLQISIPARFQPWAAMPAEFIRSATYLYPRHELAVLQSAPATVVTPR